jgi:hypothetical protein
VILVDGKPLMSADNTRSMISLLTTFAGFTVLFRMCVPFSRYRIFVYSFSLGVNVFLAFAMPSVYVGGRSWSFQDIIKNGWNSELFKNFFNLNSPVFASLGTPEYVTLGLFIAVGLPVYIFVSKYVAKWANGLTEKSQKA